MLVFESSLMTTAPAELNVSVPASNVPPPSVIDVPLTSAKLVTVTLVAVASVIAAVESRSRLSAVLTPTMLVFESSLMTTAPALLNVRLPKSVALPTSSPSVMDEPEKLALLVIARSPSAPSVIAPFAETVRLADAMEPSKAAAPVRAVSVRSLVPRSKD